LALIRFAAQAKAMSWASVSTTPSCAIVASSAFSRFCKCACDTPRKCQTKIPQFLVTA
jgi:hypothetical protein